MLKNNPSSDFENEPHTLRSDLPCNGIPICKPAHLSSQSLLSNSLQISQSPTQGFITQDHKSQCKISGMQAFSINTNLQNEISHYGSVPLDAFDLSHTTSQTGSALNTSAETKSHVKEMPVTKGKCDEQAKMQEHKSLPPTEDPKISPCPPRNPPTGLSYEPSSGTSFHDESNHACTPPSNIAFSPSPECIATSATAFCSDIPSSMKFYSFVILHVPEDQEEASRVCEILNNLEVGTGITFCEGFETAGASPLKCLEDAVENSAYIVLLLTNGFLSKWGEFQTNTVLMNSIDDKNKSDTVIPFIPKFKTPTGKIPLALKALIPLMEMSHSFKNKVRNTFKCHIIKRQQERWKREQDLRAFERSVEDAKDLSNALEMQQRIAMDHQALAHLCAQMSSFLFNLPQQIIPGHGSVIQINNASNVQIGNQNSMNVQQTTNVPQMGQSGESYRECDKEFQC